MIQRPGLEYNDKKHEYRLNGEKLLGVSTVAKIGDTDIWGVASAWAFRIGYEGAFDIIRDKDLGLDAPLTKDDLREALKRARKTPWHKTDESKDRGNSIHAALESLAQNNVVPVLEDYPEAQRGYIRGLCAWYVDYRPSFEATEVQVVSEKYLYAGRYDMRCIIETGNITCPVELLLVDLKTGKHVYGTTQYVQLAGYELASVEMGYTPTDSQYILNVKEDGTYEFAKSCATPDDFLAYLAAHRVIQRIKKEAKDASS